MRTDGVHYRESVGTGPVVNKVVPVTDAAFSGFTMDQFLRASLSFPTPYTTPLYWYSQWKCGNVRCRKVSEEWDDKSGSPEIFYNSKRHFR